MFRYLFPIVLLLACTGCNDVFDITPYDTPSGSDPAGLTKRNINGWKERSAGFEGPITIALTSDPHYYYGDLADVIDRVNLDPSVEVVIVPGDLTDQGLLGEFELFTNVMARCQHPWIATIGNHDHLSNGRQIYEQMFGPRNFHVDLRGHRFIFFDNTVWESDMPPDLGWLQQTLASSGDLKPVLIAHIPKHDAQLENGYGSSIVQLLEQYGSKLFLAGHVHGFSDRFEQDVRYVTIPWPRERHYVKVVLDGDQVQVHAIAL
jgi:predicted phosphodiesterase